MTLRYLQLSEFEFEVVHGADGRHCVIYALSLLPCCGKILTFVDNLQLLGIDTSRRHFVSHMYVIYKNQDDVILLSDFHTEVSVNTPPPERKFLTG